MQWGQIKTLLIAAFLILDIYLFVQFMDKKEAADIGVLEQHTLSVEEQLRDDRITYEPLPDEEYEETFIAVEQHEFSDADLRAERKESKQTTTVVQNDLIVSKVEDRISISETASEEQIMNTFSKLVYFSDEYTFWNWNEEENILVFFQNKFNRPVYYNQNGLVLVFLNGDNEVDFYIQSMLGEAESLAEKRELMKPMEAIETLYRANELPFESHINNVNIGFHTRVPFETDVQVFAPIWKVKVNENQNYFINAIEGFIFSTDESEFLDEVIQLATDKIRMQRHNHEKLEDIYEILELRLEEKDTYETLEFQLEEG